MIQQSFPHADHRWYGEIYNTRSGGGDAPFRRTLICAPRTSAGIAEGAGGPIVVKPGETRVPTPRGD